MFLEFVNYLGGVLGRANGQESMNFSFLFFLITNVPESPDMLKGDLNLTKVPRQQAQEEEWGTVDKDPPPCFLVLMFAV